MNGSMEENGSEPVIGKPKKERIHALQGRYRTEAEIARFKKLERGSQEFSKANAGSPAASS
ncbi:MAG: hypothetical protein U0894_13070 [Pirellulales bacterium]